MSLGYTLLHLIFTATHPEGRGSIPKKEVEAEGPSNLFICS